MDKNEIIKILLERGSQIDEKALNILLEDKTSLNRIINFNKSQLPPVITEPVLKNLLTTDSIFLLKERRQKAQLTPKDFHQISTRRYEFLKNVLGDHPELSNLISINKINNKLTKFSIIGMVSEINQTITLEDSTGSSTFVIDDEQKKFIVEDEVIGVICERQNEQNIIKKVVYPDIQLKKTITKLAREERFFFISDIHMDSSKFNKEYYKNFLNWLNEQKNIKIFVLGGISTKKQDFIKFIEDIKIHPTFVIDENRENSTEVSTFPEPAFIQIQEFNLVLSKGNFLERYMERWKTTTENVLVNLLRKRHLDPIFKPEEPDDIFLLDIVPDVIVLGNTKEATLTNYKGTTILTNGSFLTKPVYWLIDLKTRETFKLDFS